MSSSFSSSSAGDHEGGQSGSNAIATCDKTCDVITLMKQRLPGYIVNCFMSSGYDEMEVISTMDTSERKDNSINKIKKFIQCKYANSAKHNPFPSPAFEFPPGHKFGF